MILAKKLCQKDEGKKRQSQGIDEIAGWVWRERDGKVRKGIRSKPLSNFTELYDAEIDRKILDEYKSFN